MFVSLSAQGGDGAQEEEQRRPRDCLAASQIRRASYFSPLFVIVLVSPVFPLLSSIRDLFVLFFFFWKSLLGIALGNLGCIIFFLNCLRHILYPWFDFPGHSSFQFPKDLWSIHPSQDTPLTPPPSPALPCRSLS